MVRPRMGVKWMASILVVLPLVLCSCASPEVGEAPPVPKITNFEVGPWVNIHRKNPDLVGVRVQQFPDCQYEAKRYEGKHPAMVIYVFRSGWAHQVEYAPDGRIESGFWWKVAPDHCIWERLDRSVREEPGGGSGDPPP
jgi:hypothetical protein